MFIHHITLVQAIWQINKKYLFEQVIWQINKKYLKKYILIYNNVNE